MAEITNYQKSVAHENIVIGINLSLIGGFLDAYTYILKGNVFANAQTGNLVLLFIACVNGNLTKVVVYSIPILMFALGILFSEMLKNNQKWNINNKRIKLILFVEILIIIGVAFSGKFVSKSIINCTISFLAAIQVANFDKINGISIATTMITGNLRNSMISINKYILTKDKIYRKMFMTYLIIITSFGIGVSTGSILAKFFGDYSILTCIIFIFFAYIAIRKEEINY